MNLLTRWAGCTEEALPLAARDVMVECGRLPLALAICGAMVRDGTSWADLLAALREADLEFLEHPHGNVLKSIKVSIDALAEDQKRRFAELSVFPPDETIPEAAVETLWAHTGALADRHARRLLTFLERRSLVNLDTEASRAGDGSGSEVKRRVSLHDLLYDYAVRLAGDPAAAHKQLLDAYRKRCPGGWPAGPDDGYFFTHLRHHLEAAGTSGEILDLLLGGEWLESKAEHGHVFDLPLDFDAARRIDVDDPSRRLNLNLLDEALRRDIHFIARHPGLLFQCLWNTGWWYDCPDAALHYDPPPGGWSPQGPPWDRPEPERLSALLDAWRTARQQSTPGLVWLRSLRPPNIPLGGPQRAVFHGHKNQVASVAFDSAGRRIVSGSWDETVRVWDAENGLELACLRGHESKVTSVAFDSAGRRIVSGSDDHKVRVWDAESGLELACLRGHEKWVTSVGFDSAGRRIVSGSDDQTVRVWDAESGLELACLRGHKSRVTSVAFDVAGRRIVSGSADETVRVWDAESGFELSCLRGHEKWVTSVAFDVAGRRIVSGSWDETVHVWDAESGLELACLRGHKSRVTSVAFDGAGRRIVSGSVDETVRVWDAESGLELACLRGHESKVTSVAFDAAGGRIVIGSDDKSVRVWDADSGLKLACLRGHESRVTSVAFDGAGRRIVSGSWDETVRVWDVESGLELACLRGHERLVASVAFDGAGRRIVSGSWDHTVRVWDADNGLELACLRGHEGRVTSVAFDGAGRRIVSGSDDTTVRIWHADSGVELACLRGHEQAVMSVAFDSAGRRIVSGSWDQMVRVWDADSGVALEVLPRTRDVVAIAAGDAAYPWRALALGLETVIRPASGGQAVAWFPVALESIATHPSGRLWAGVIDKRLYLVRLEGPGEE